MTPPPAGAQQVFTDVYILEISSQTSNLHLTSPYRNTFIIYLQTYLLPSLLSVNYPSCYAKTPNLSHGLDWTPLLVSHIHLCFMC